MKDGELARPQAQEADGPSGPQRTAREPRSRSPCIHGLLDCWSGSCQHVPLFPGAAVSVLRAHNRSASSRTRPIRQLAFTTYLPRFARRCPPGEAWRASNRSGFMSTGCMPADARICRADGWTTCGIRRLRPVRRPPGERVRSRIAFRASLASIGRLLLSCGELFAEGGEGESPVRGMGDPERPAVG